MSTIIMTACWPLQGMTPAQKAVLISLADNANDEGVCWPSVKRIAERTCLSERAVQGALRWLTSAGLLVAKERDGRSTVYEITPAAYAPPQELRGAGNAPTPAAFAPTPADAAPAPADAAPRTVKNHQRTNREPKVVIAPPPGVSDAVWADYLKYRNAQKVPVNGTVLKRLTKQLLVAAEAGWMPDDALAEAMSAGWRGLNAEWLQNRAGRRPPASGQSFAQQRTQAEIDAFVNGPGCNNNVIEMEACRAGF